MEFFLAKEYPKRMGNVNEKAKPRMQRANGGVRAY